MVDLNKVQIFPNESARSWAFSNFYSKQKNEGPSNFGPYQTLVIGDLRSAYNLKENICFFNKNLRVDVLVPLETDLLRNRGPSLNRRTDRIRTLFHLSQSKLDLLILPVESLFVKTPDLHFWSSHSCSFRVGETLTRKSLSEKLGVLGYQPAELVEVPLQYAARGSIVDVFCPLYTHPLRFELYEDQIQSIRTFYPDSQRKIEDLDSAEITPAREFLYPESEVTVSSLKSAVRLHLEASDWLRPERDALLNRVEQKSFFSTVDYWGPFFRSHQGDSKNFKPHKIDWVFDSNIVQKELKTRKEVIFSDFTKARAEGDWVPASEFFTNSVDDISLSTVPAFDLGVNPTGSQKSLDLLNYNIRATAENQRGIPFEGFVQNLRPFLENKFKIVFCGFNQGAVDRLNFLSSTYRWAFKYFDSFEDLLKSDSALCSVVGELDEGFIDSENSFIIIPESFIFETKKKNSRSQRSPYFDKKNNRSAFSNDVFLLSLEAGDHVVHKEHGVGKYLGLRSLNVGGITTEFIEIEYRDSNKLMVPITKLGLIQRHSGKSESVSIDRLGGQTWESKKTKAKKELASIAADLLNLYSLRALGKGPEIHPTVEDLNRFASTFPYEETPDQRKAIEDTLQDLKGPRPMDRLICGDVGYGKTEVAMRAAHAAVTTGFQVAILVPTTLLATQHENNFKRRFSKMGINVAGLSRFKSNSEVKKTLSDLKENKVQIVIGTHKLLGSTVLFNNLGLLVIDEEQKFGVVHKEKIKKMRSNVHVLSMTATPIPRTLNFAMSGLRELSIISTPPQNRMSVRTFIAKKKEDLIRDAVENELKRGGQVFYVHNRVQTIDKEFAWLSPLLPSKTKLDVAHGQMEEEVLEQKMVEFYEGRTQVLLATSIIESGLDVPNANTLIVDRADAFGLAQLYQIRGRVGRSDQRGYAYFLVPEKAPITDEAEERLRVLESYQELGSGFHIASHDLDLRGAGEFLGKEQSGSMSALGYDAFIDLLNECMGELKGETLQSTLDPEINLGMDITIPESYIKDIGLRLMFYRKLSTTDDESETSLILEELGDRFGPPPPSVENLTVAMRIKAKLRKLGIRSIHSGSTGFSLSFDTQTPVKPQKMVLAVQKYPNHFQLHPDGRLLIRNLSGQFSQKKALEHIQTLLEEIQTWISA
jgi:transcription-repair coupling factor (superfamily II helicase)